MSCLIQTTTAQMVADSNDCTAACIKGDNISIISIRFNVAHLCAPSVLTDEFKSDFFSLFVCVCLLFALTPNCIQFEQMMIVFDVKMRILKSICVLCDLIISLDTRLTGTTAQTKMKLQPFGDVCSEFNPKKN